MLSRISHPLSCTAIVTSALLVCWLMLGLYTAIFENGKHEIPAVVEVFAAPEQPKVKTPVISAKRTEANTPEQSVEAIDLPKSTVEIVVTFDDGPHTDCLGKGRNFTENIINTLEKNGVQNRIKAAFFVQTHVPYRGGCRLGRKVMTLAHQQGHLVTIHTGSEADHTLHKHRVVDAAYSIDEDSDTDGLNGLESDLIRAKLRIAEITGELPTFVRAPTGPPEGTNPAVFETYARQGLKHIFWDVDSGDSHCDHYTPDQIEQLLYERTVTQLNKGKHQLIVLFHDISCKTQANLENYLQTIQTAVESTGKTAKFVTSRARIQEIFESYEDRFAPQQPLPISAPIASAQLPYGF